VFCKINDMVINKISLKGEANIFVEFKERLNFEELSGQKGSFDEMEEKLRGRLIMNSLMEVANRSQKKM